jgi:hypothetical protein
MTDPCAAATVQIDARPGVVYGLITDLPTPATLAEEAVAIQWRKGDAVRQGAVFIGHNTSGSRATGVPDWVAANTKHIQLTLQRLKNALRPGNGRPMELP